MKLTPDTHSNTHSKHILKTYLKKTIKDIEICII